MTHNPCVVDLIRGHAAGRPADIALRTPAGTMTYARLWNRAEQAGRALAGRGVRHGDTVLVRLPSGPEAVVAMLGAWLAGAAFVPVDTATPAERLAYVLRDSGATAVLDDGTALLPPAGDPGEPAGDPVESAGPRTADDEHGAYVIYTSGSTGAPKESWSGTGRWRAMPTRPWTCSRSGRTAPCCSSRASGSMSPRRRSGRPSPRAEPSPSTARTASPARLNSPRSPRIWG